MRSELTQEVIKELTQEVIKETTPLFTKFKN